MIRFHIIILVWFLNLGLLPAQDSLKLKEISLEDVFERGTFSVKQVPGFNFMKDGEHYLKLSNNRLSKYSILTGKEVSTVFDLKVDSKGQITKDMSSYQFSEDESRLLIGTESHQIYRHSSKGIYYIYDFRTKTVQKVFDKSKIMYPHFNPQADKIAFVYENNIYYKDLLTQKTIQVTKDGKNNAIINGASDWVYEEEFAITRSFEWSKAGNRIAFIRYDESQVKEFRMEYFNDGEYPDPYTFKYPKVGEKNAAVSVWIYDLKKKKSKPCSFIHSNTDIYIPRIQWTQDNDVLCITHLNRHQNHLSLILANAKTNTSKILLEEKNKYYIDIHDNLKFLKTGKSFLWTSEMDGYNHVYLYGLDGKLIGQLTSGKHEITDLYGYDEARNQLYYQAAFPDELNRQIFKYDVSNKSNISLTPDLGYHTAQFGPTFTYYTIQASNMHTPPVITLRDGLNKTVRTLEDNSTLVKKLNEYTFSPLEAITIRNSNNDVLNAIMIKPLQFDANKKYPVFMHLYGGPGSQQVSNRWSPFGQLMWFQMLAQKGYIICVVDNRGTGARGEEFKKMTYLQLGKYETEDQIDAAKYLASLPYVDGSRIGIYGWSYGGYMSSLCLLKGNDVFKAAIAVAPVTNWKWYDSAYTERFMRNAKENEKGYKENSPVYFADRLKGNYLLVHGMTDDNVHFQNTAEMVKELIKHKKQFDTYFYPNRNHGISGENARIHLFTKMTQFVYEKI